MKKSGIYKIVNAVTNKEYVGSSIDILHRWRQHRYDLGKNQHTNQHLQNAWNKYGKESFFFLILEECVAVKETLLDREQHYIDALKPEYNILPTAGSRLGSEQSEETKEKIRNTQRTEEARQRARETRAKQVITEETKLKLSEAGKRRVFSEETKNKLSISNTGKKHSDETKAKISKAGKGRPCSEETCLKRSKSLTGKVRSNEAKQRYSESKIGNKNGVGERSETSKENMRRAQGRQYRLVSPTKVEYILTTYELKCFCVQNDLVYGSLWYAKKDNRPYKGWLIKEI